MSSKFKLPQILRFTLFNCSKNSSMSNLVETMTNLHHSMITHHSAWITTLHDSSAVAVVFRLSSYLLHLIQKIWVCQIILPCTYQNLLSCIPFQPCSVPYFLFTTFHSEYIMYIHWSLCIPLCIPLCDYLNINLFHKNLYLLSS